MICIVGKGGVLRQGILGKFFVFSTRIFFETFAWLLRIDVCTYVVVCVCTLRYVAMCVGGVRVFSVCVCMCTCSYATRLRSYDCKNNDRM